MGPAHNSIHWCVMKLARWGYIASAVLLASTLAFTSCDKNKENKEENFSYTGKWATVKVMNQSIASDEEKTETIKALISSIDLLFNSQLQGKAAEYEEFVHKAITETVNFAQGITITVSAESNTCNVTFSGLKDGANGTWKEENGKLVLQLNEIPQATLDQLKAEADKDAKRKISYAFAKSISSKTLTLSKTDEGELKYKLEPAFVKEAFSAGVPSEKMQALMVILEAFTSPIGKSVDITFHKVG